MTSKPTPPKSAAQRPASPRGTRGPRASAASSAKATSASAPVASPRTADVGGRPPPIFVHSSFRTSSTWLWTCFRAAQNTVAYCEIFHEILATLTVDQIPSISPNTWRSRHPPSSPYFVEFFDLLRPKGGARGFRPEFAFKTFVPQDGPRGDVTQPELDYVANLIRNPADSSRVTVLTDNRTLGRCVGLKRHFGGLHILAYRNLFQQWNSYSNQQRNDNRYFLDTIKYTIENSQHMEFFRKLKDFLHLRDQDSTEDWLERCAYDDIFVAFVAMHLYFYMAIFDDMDVLIDTNRLAVDPGYVGQIEDMIATGGVRIDLSSASTTIEAPLRPLGDATGARFKIETLFQHAMQEMKASAEAEAFARRLVDEMWAEQTRFTFYTRSLFATALDQHAVDAEAIWSERHEAVQTALDAKSAEMDAASRRLRALEAELDGVRDAAQRMVTDSALRHQIALATQREEIDRLRTEMAQDKAKSGELAARIEALEIELRHEGAFNAKLTTSVDALQDAFGAIQHELSLRGDAGNAPMLQRIAALANDVDAKVLAMIEAVDDLAGVLGRDREALARYEARSLRDQSRIIQLLARRQAIIEQRDAVLDLVQTARSRHQLALTLANRTGDRLA